METILEALDAASGFRGIAARLRNGTIENMRQPKLTTCPTGDGTD